VTWRNDGPYPVNQHCATNDLRFLYNKQSFGGSSTWAIAGGDTVLIRGCYNVDENYDGATYCRIGDSPPGRTGTWCGGGGAAATSRPAGRQDR